MTLDWNSNSCNPPLPQDDAESAMRYKLIWLMPVIGMMQISRTNAPEVFSRIRLYHTLAGTDSSEWVHVDHIWRWVGLRTNVREETPNQYMKRMVGADMTKWRRLMADYIKDKRLGYA